MNTKLMGMIAEYLRNLIAKQVDDHGLVLWFDPEGHYAKVASDLAIPNTTVARYDGSFFALRHQIEPLLQGIEPPRLVVYIPRDRSRTHSAMIEAETAGVIMQPGQQPPSRNTRLSIVARNALKQSKQWTEEDAEQVAKDIEAGKYQSLDEIEQIVVRRGEATGVLQLLFGTGDPVEVALKFLSDSSPDAGIQDKYALPELTQLMNAKFGIGTMNDETVEPYRTRLARHLLTTDLAATLAGELPAQLSAVPRATTSVAVEACVHLAKTWRNRRDLQQSYAHHAERVAKELNLVANEFKPDQITQVETFLEIESALQRGVESLLSQSVTDELLQLARQRQSSFWSELMPEVQAHWALIAVSGQLLSEADRIESEIKSAKNAKTIFETYTAGEQPWCLLDTQHRHLERRFHNFDFDDRHEGLHQLVAKARNRYTQIGGALAEQFLRQFQEAGYQIPGALRQTEIYGHKVRSKLHDGKTAYVCVDALRYEMARELAQTISTEFEDLNIEAAIGAVPTITAIGMAALLPDAEASAIISTREDKLALVINDAVVKERKDRVSLLKTNAGLPVFEAKLEELLPRPRKKVREGIHEAGLILVTSQEIDQLCEGDNVALARRHMDEILYELRRALRVLSELGVQHFIITADHGHLFGEELESDMKIEAPGGETIYLNRRVWLGRGGTSAPSFLRARLADFGLESDLEIAVPWNFAGFKVRSGARAYFHGGMSPQELIIPVITLRARKVEPAALTSEIAWELIPGSRKISTRFFSVQIKGSSMSLFELVPPKIRVEIRAKAESLSTPVSASHGFEEGTGDVQLRKAETEPNVIEPNTVTMMIAPQSTQKHVTVHLLDAASGTELLRLEKIEMAIAI
ncbi:PglZ domain-containing protein [candidate division KSB1 bacterium]|nr:PglZ domain-containing protein [candidate division KSB1 bacterium]